MNDITYTLQLPGGEFVVWERSDYDHVEYIILSPKIYVDGEEITPVFTRMRGGKWVLDVQEWGAGQVSWHEDKFPLQTDTIAKILDRQPLSEWLYDPHFVQRSCTIEVKEDEKE